MLRAVPVRGHCIKALRLACQNLYSLEVVGCRPKNVTRAPMCCKYSAGVYL